MNEAEDRWRRALHDHEADPRAHSAERHAQNEEWLSQQIAPLRQELLTAITERRVADQLLGERIAWSERMIWLAMGGLGALSLIVSGRILGLIPNVG